MGVRLLIVLGAATLGGGCRPPVKPAAPPAVAPPTVAPAQNSEPEAPGKGPAIKNGAAGQVSLGMKQETVQALPGLRANMVTVREGKAERPVLVLSKGNRMEMLAELKEGQVSRIRVLSPTYHVAGVKIGDRAKRLNTLFGAGLIAKDGGEIAVRFKKAPGLAFGFSPGSEPVKSWPEAVKKGLNLTSIIIEGRG